MTMETKIAWGITGAGHFLPECAELISRLGPRADLFISGAAREVLADYGLWHSLKAAGGRIYCDESRSAMAVTKLYSGAYAAVVIAPITGNSLAKMALGIADTLVTNLFAHSGKCSLPIILLPCDIEDTTQSLTHKQGWVTVLRRDVERQNIRSLAAMDGVTIATDPDNLSRLIGQYI